MSKYNLTDSKIVSDAQPSEVLKLHMRIVHWNATVNMAKLKILGFKEGQKYYNIADVMNGGDN